MRISELLENENWLDAAKDKLSSFGDYFMHGPQDPIEKLYRPFIKDNLNRYGSQRTMKMLIKEFPKAARTDLVQAMKLEIGA